MQENNMAFAAGLAKWGVTSPLPFAEEEKRRGEESLT